MRIWSVLLGFTCLFIAGNALARDTKHMFSIEEALTTSAAVEKLDKSVKFYFGKQPNAKVEQKFEEVQSNKKTNAFLKSDKEACEWAFLSAMLSFQETALARGANAVVNIYSYYKKHKVSSLDQYECGAGAVMAGVTFRGTIVKLAK